MEPLQIRIQVGLKFSDRHPICAATDPVELQSALKSWGTSPNLRIPPIPQANSI
jgi:hypothetical protein